MPPYPIVPSRISPALLAGPRPATEEDVARLGGEGVTDVLDLREEYEWKGHRSEAAVKELERHGIRRHAVSMGDHKEPSAEALAKAVAVIDEILGTSTPVEPEEREEPEEPKEPEEPEEPARVLYIHCRAGIERTAMVLIAWYARHYHVTYTEALQLLRKKRPALDPLPGQEAAVRTFLAS